MDEQMQKVRGVRDMGRYGRMNDQEDIKLYDFLSIFHPEMSHATKVQMVLEAHPNSTINRSGKVSG